MTGLSTPVSTSELHVVLGAAGAAGSALIRELARRSLATRAVSRSVIPDLPAGMQWRGADVTDTQSIAQSIEGASVVYMAAQPAYTRWTQEFSAMLNAVIEAVAGSGARLVMVDNLYTYGPVHGPLTEDSPERPQSRKGQVRLQLAQTLLGAHQAGRLRAVILRAGDFYGPGVQGSVVGAPFFGAVLSGKRPQWVGRSDQLHSFTFVDDFARALVLAGERPEGDGQVWHVPAAEALSGTHFAERIAQEAHVVPRPLNTLTGLPLRLVSLFVPIVREMAEIEYQVSAPFVTDGRRFAEAFDFQPTPHEHAVRQTVAWCASQQNNNRAIPKTPS